MAATPLNVIPSGSDTTTPILVDEPVETEAADLVQDDELTIAALTKMQKGTKRLAKKRKLNVATREEAAEESSPTTSQGRPFDSSAAESEEVPIKALPIEGSVPEAPMTSATDVQPTVVTAKKPASTFDGSEEVIVTGSRSLTVPSPSSITESL